MIGEIGSHLDITDLSKVRLINKRFKKAVDVVYGKRISVTANVTVFPTFASVAALFIGLGLDGAYPDAVRTITLVSEGPAAPEYSYSYLWRYFDKVEIPGMPERTYEQWSDDADILEYADNSHERWNRINDAFCHTGRYRTMLSKSPPIYGFAKYSWVVQE